MSSPRRSVLWVYAEATHGSELRETVADGIDLAKRLGCGVIVPFNNYALHLVGESSVDVEVECYRQAVARGRA